MGIMRIYKGTGGATYSTTAPENKETIWVDNSGTAPVPKVFNSTSNTWVPVSSATGDMLKSIYDINGNNIIDNAEALNGQPASYYAKASDVTANTNNLGLLPNLTTNNKTSAVNAINELVTNINTLTGGMNWKGDVASYAALTATASPVKGDTYVVDTDENHSNARTFYVYSGTAWTYIGQFNYVPDATTSTKGILQLSGDFSGTAVNPQLISTGVTAGTYNFAKITVDSKGRITLAQNGLTQSSTAPSTPNTNDLWIDTTNSALFVLKQYNGTTWISTGTKNVPYDVGNYTTTYTYNADGTIQKVQITGDVIRTTTYTYYGVADGDKNGKIKTETIQENGKTITSTYDYNSQGQILPVSTTTT